MRVRGALGVGALGLMLMAGCAAETKLRPMPEAGVLQDKKNSAAITEQEGVRLTADGSAWRGFPSDLERRITPVYVRLENQGQRPLRIQYKDFSLVGQESRFRYSALPPMSLQRATSSRDTEAPATISPAQVTLGRGGYAYGPWRGWGPTWGSPWNRPFYGPYFSGPPYYYDPPLPTEDMLHNALPEGTLEPGGTMQGFLYFQGVTRREDAVTLQVKMVDAGTGEPFGSLGIPFQVSK